MTVKDLIDGGDFKAITVADEAAPITGGYCGDLLSIVMGNAPENSAWITIQSHVNIVAVASLRGISAIIIAHGFTPDEDTVETAKEEDVTILKTQLQPFEAAKLLVEKYGL